MSRFTIREYSDFGMVPQDQTRILFESDNLSEVKEFIKDYFTYEDYFNAVYFMDNKLNKQGYVGKDLKINCGESLSDFCEIQEGKELEYRLECVLSEVQNIKLDMRSVCFPNDRMLDLIQQIHDELNQM